VLSSENRATSAFVERACPAPVPVLKGVGNARRDARDEPRGASSHSSSTRKLSGDDPHGLLGDHLPAELAEGFGEGGAYGRLLFAGHLHRVGEGRDGGLVSRPGEEKARIVLGEEQRLP
jgi:hypothetical protein